MATFDSIKNKKEKDIPNLKLIKFNKILYIVGGLIMSFCFLMFVNFVFKNSKKNDRNPHKFKYYITYGFGNKMIIDVTTGDIQYLEGGRIKYESFNKGHPDTVIVGGTYLIENYH